MGNSSKCVRVFFKITIWYDDCVAHSWSSLHDLLEAVTSNGFPLVSEEFWDAGDAEYLLALFAFISVAHPIPEPSLVGFGQRTVEASHVTQHPIPLLGQIVLWLWVLVILVFTHLSAGVVSDPHSPCRCSHSCGSAQWREFLSPQPGGPWCRCYGDRWTVARGQNPEACHWEMGDGKTQKWRSVHLSSGLHSSHCSLAFWSHQESRKS